MISAGYELKAIYIDSPFLYIVYAGGFIVADISNPSDPKIISSLNNPFPGTSIRDVEIYENYAYLTIYKKGIQTVDISDKYNPKYGEIITLPGYNRPWREFAENGYLYVASGTDNRLDILDISNPSNPHIIGSYSPGLDKNSFSGVAVKGNYAYVAEYHNGIRVIDISNPENPFEVSNLMDINANDIKISGNYAYVSVRYQGFDIIDLSNPKHIFITGTGKGKLSGYNEGIFATKEYTFLAGESKGFGIYDTTNVQNPLFLVNVPVIGGIDSITVKDDYAYIGAHNDGMWIINVHDKKNPFEIAFIATPGRFDSVFLQNDYLFSAGQWGGLNLIDVSDPYNPKEIFLDYNGNIGSVVGDEKYLYTSKGIVSIKDPSSPEYISKEYFFKGVCSLLQKNRLLVAARTGNSYGVRAIDISDKSNPNLLSTYNIDTRFQDVKSFSDKAVALSGNTISIIDYSDIYNPILVDKINYKGKWTGRSIDLEDGICYAAGGPVESIKVFDLSDFKEINLISSSNIPGYYNCIDYEEEFIYTGHKYGLYILTADKKYASPVFESSKKSDANNYEPENTDSNYDLNNIKTVQPKLIPIISIFVIIAVLIFVFYTRSRR